MNEKDFLEKYNINKSTFATTGLSFKLLTEIQKDYISQFQKFDDAGANLVRSLLRYPLVHSVKYRIKDPEHLMAKIIRKYEKQPKLDININNYQDHIQDIIGIRILHLFKTEWNIIHQRLKDDFKLIGKPVANLRKGDLSDFIDYYKNNGCKIKNHSAGYRSVHYIIKTETTKKPIICEVQVRTIFEEAWSEIDHKVRYPYFTNNVIVNQYLDIFNRLAGSADEMGEFVLHLKEAVLLNAEQQDLIEKLHAQIKNSSLKNTERLEIESGLNKIAFPNLTSRFIGLASIGSQLTQINGLESPIITTKYTSDLSKKILAFTNLPVIDDIKS